MILSGPYEILSDLFVAGLRAVDPSRLIKNIMKLEKNALVLKIDNDYHLYNLDNFDEIQVIGAGKASERMAEGIYDVLGDNIIDGLVVTKSRRYGEIGSIKIIEAGHPIPDNKSVEAGIAIQNITHLSDEKTLIISLISGGASSLVEVPRIENVNDEEIKLSIEDLIETNHLLLKSGATISEINCVRKHLSMIKGGYLSAWMYPATALNLFLSDVEDDRIDIIGSGLTTYDKSSFTDMQEIVEKYKLYGVLPERIIRIIHRGTEGKIFETPKTQELVFERTENIIIGNNRTALMEIEKRANELGFDTLYEDLWVKGDSVEKGRELFRKALSIKKDDNFDKPLIIISGGETTVTVNGDGIGGRNQELALGFLNEMEQYGKAGEDIFLLSASTDGDDGPTDAAGAFASYQVLKKGRSENLKVEEFLLRNDSYSFFDKCGFLYKTGFTQTNVCDVQIVLIK